MFVNAPLGLKSKKSSKCTVKKSDFFFFLVSSELTVSCPAGVTLRAVGRVGRGDGGHAGAPDKAEGGEATRSCAAGGETWRA